MSIELIFGWIASILTALIFAPQLYKAFSTYQTNDISMLMMVLAVLANAAWLIHASISGNVPLMVCASLIILMSLVLIVFKYHNDRK